MGFNRSYFILAVVVFMVEVSIALFVHDKFIRPYLGDVLVVVLIYAFIRSFFKIPFQTACWLVLCFAFAIEGLQSINIVQVLGLQQYKWARVVIGTSFSWIDLGCYAVGIASVYLVEKSKTKHLRRR